MTTLSIEIDGKEFRGVIARLKAQTARKQVEATFPRVAKQLRTEIVRRVQGRWPKIPAREARQRITINIPEGRFRIYGAGQKQGGKFVRPRWLNLNPKNVGGPTWMGLRQLQLPRTFAATPLGAKSILNKDLSFKSSGRTFANALVRRKGGGWKAGRGFKMSKATVFQRKSERGRAIQPVQGPLTMGQMVRAAVGMRWVEEQLKKRMAAEAKRRLDVAAGKSTARR